jgi:uncharacterized protein YbcI
MLTGGALLAAISSSVVALFREHYGRGPIKAKTYALDDLLIVVLRGSGFTPLEQTLMDDDGGDRVVAMRHEFQRVMAPRFTQIIEDLTRRRVTAFLSHAHVEPDITVEIFCLEGMVGGVLEAAGGEGALPARGPATA